MRRPSPVAFDMVGKPVVAGTGITANLLLDELPTGESTEQILDSWPTLSCSGVHAAVEFAAGVLAAVVWRVELEICGWDGLAWIGYFHWAIPAGTLMFAVWLFVFAPIDTALVRGAFVLSTAAAGAVWFVVVHAALLHHFAGGPGALVRLLVLGERLYRFSRYGVYAAVPLTPLVFAGLLCAFGRKPGAGRLALALLSHVLAWPVSIAILVVLRHRGGAEALHAIKSGIIIPFLFIGLGVLVPAKDQVPRAHERGGSPPWETHSSR